MAKLAAAAATEAATDAGVDVTGILTGGTVIVADANVAVVMAEDTANGGDAPMLLVTTFWRMVSGVEPGAIAAVTCDGITD